MIVTESQRESRGKKKVNSGAKFALRLLQSGPALCSVEDTQNPHFVSLPKVAKEHKIRIWVHHEHANAGNGGCATTARIGPDVFDNLANSVDNPLRGRWIALSDVPVDQINLLCSQRAE